ncbi:hypothetical protein [Rhodococcus rhodochrous]|uniref:hypothetical protein n=1 Tax=Rhodococcus rhodochrous TaxID=1829 RepID=UPI0002D84EF5|nr:hypothetical protein [Rhodococcus rhodochrous]
MNDLASPRLQVVVDDVSAPARVLADVKSVTALGFADLAVLIEQWAPVLDIEMFTNDWYDGAAARVLALLSGWDTRGVGYILREVPAGTHHRAAGKEGSRIGLDELRTIVGTGAEDLARLEETAGRGCAGAS